MIPLLVSHINFSNEGFCFTFRIFDANIYIIDIIVAKEMSETFKLTARKWTEIYMAQRDGLYFSTLFP